MSFPTIYSLKPVSYTLFSTGKQWMSTQLENGGELLVFVITVEETRICSTSCTTTDDRDKHPQPCYHQ